MKRFILSVAVAVVGLAMWSAEASACGGSCGGGARPVGGGGGGDADLDGLLARRARIAAARRGVAPQAVGRRNPSFRGNLNRRNVPVQRRTAPLRIR